MPTERRKTNQNFDVPKQSLQIMQPAQRKFSKIDQVPEVQDSTLGKALTALQGAMPAVDKIRADIQKDIEKDKTVQTNRKELGLNPTKDATKEGIAATRAVDVRNKAYEVAGRLSARIKSFDGTDDEWTAIVAQGQEEVAALAGNNKDLIKAGSDVFREQLPALSKQRGQYKEIKHQEAMYNINRSSLIAAVEGDLTPEQVRLNVSKVLTEMHMQGFSSDIAKKTIIDTATFLADERDDATLLDFIKEQQPDWYRDSPSLIQTEKQLDNRTFANSQGQAASMKDNLITKFQQTTTLTKEDWYKQGGKLEIAGKRLYSDEQLLAQWNLIEKQRKEEFTNDSLFQHIVALSTDPTLEPVTYAAVAKLTDKQKGKLIETYDDYQNKQLVDMKNNGANDEELMNFRDTQVVEKAKMLAAANIEDPSWKVKFSLLDKRDFTNLVPGKDKLPQGVKDAFSIMDALSQMPATLKSHASNKAIALHTAFKSNIEMNMDEVSAYNLAYKMANTKPATLNKEERKSVDNKISDVVEDAYTHWWSSDIPEQQSQTIQGEIRSRAMELITAGVNQDEAVKMAGKQFKQEYHQLPNGKLLKGNVVNMARMAGVSVQRFDQMIDELPERIINDFDLDDDFVIDPYTPVEEWYPRITNEGMVYFTDATGNFPITRRIDLINLSGKTRAEWAKEAQEKLNIDMRKAKGMPYKFEESGLKYKSSWDNVEPEFKQPR